MKRRAALLPRVQSLVETNNIPLPPRALPGTGGIGPSHHHCLLGGALLCFVVGHSVPAFSGGIRICLSTLWSTKRGFPQFLTFIFSLCLEAGAVLHPGQGRAGQGSLSVSLQHQEQDGPAAPRLFGLRRQENTPRTLPHPAMQRALLRLL